MLVKDWMSKNVFTIGVDNSMQDATQILKQHHIRILPVVKKDKLVGVITDRDLKRASASDATSLEIHELLYLLMRIKVKEIMTRNPIAVPLDWTVEETAELLLNNKISGAPVVDKKDLVVGVITQTDLFRVLISLTGIHAGGVQFAFKTEDHPGTIKELADVIREFGGQMVSILSSYDKVPEGFRMVYIRMRHIDRPRLTSLQKRLMEKASLLYIIDQRENRREFFGEKAI
jgi:acetoin utilization protein AcuB